MKIKKNIAIILGVIMVLVGFNFVRVAFKNNLSAPVVLADDEEDDEEDDDDEEEGRDDEASSEAAVTYKTVYVKLPDTITEKIIQVPLHDSDSDGIYDDEDPYPTVNKFFVVADENINGIDDEYEKFGR